jgi:iron only hydrogenase large subunit-like protein
VKLDLTGDFLTPAAACIKPVPTTRRKPMKLSDTEPPDILKEVALKEAVKISLNDCLACSGCVTTAESVLVQLQSVEEVYREVNENRARTARGERPRKMAVSVAPQACASLAAYFRCSLLDAFRKVAWLMRHRLGAEVVMDTVWAQNIALLEMSREFVSKYRRREKGDIGVPLPLLASACPGWVCYAEKTHPELLPLLSTAKSPQAVLGTVVKRYFAQQWERPVEDIYHLALYACFDKKLEAARDDFTVGAAVRETDCVLSTSEVLEILLREHLDWDTIPCDEEEEKNGAAVYLSSEVAHWDPGSEFESSGGYLEFVLRYAAKELFNVDLPGPLPYKQRRNPNWQEVTLEVDGKQVLVFAIAYGFQQIQNVTRLIGGKTKGKCPYHFVEVMACPSGCLNGGGQIKAAAQRTEESNKELLSRVSKIYKDHLGILRTHATTPPVLFPGGPPADEGSEIPLPSEHGPPAPEHKHGPALAGTIAPPLVEEVYRVFIGGDIYSDAARALLHTAYHAVHPTLATQGLASPNVNNW